MLRVGKASVKLIRMNRRFGVGTMTAEGLETREEIDQRPSRDRQHFKNYFRAMKFEKEDRDLIDLKKFQSVWSGSQTAFRNRYF